MTIEELLTPRYVVELDYPQSDKDDAHTLIKDDIVMQLNVNGHMTYRRIRRCGWMSVGVPCVAHPENYPGVFRKLQWWEMRSADEMPKYVKWDWSLTGVGKAFGYEKVLRWENLDTLPVAVVGDSQVVTMGNIVVPVSEEEYIKQTATV
jgi:hypothetical protein